MLKIKIIKFSLLINTFLLISCANIKNNNIVAYNEDMSTMLTQSDFNQWLQYKPNLKYLERTEQINKYFIRQYLLKQKNILTLNDLSLFEFQNIIRSNNMATNSIKAEKFNTFVPQQNLVNNLFDSYKLGQINKQDKVRLYQIYKHYPKNSTPKQRSQLLEFMKETRSKIDNLDDFKNIASKESDAQSRLRNGLVGNVKHGLFDVKLNKIVMSLEKDEMSEVIVGKNGLVLFYCEKIIPKKIQSGQQLLKLAQERVHDTQASKQWKSFKQSTINHLDITFNWHSINADSDKSSIVAYTPSMSLTQQQFQWLVNPNSTINLSNISKSKIILLVNDYFFHAYNFITISSLEQKSIITKNNFLKDENVALSVLTQLVNGVFAPPSDAEIHDFFTSNRNKYIVPQSYDLSLLALPVTKDNKTQSYNKITEIYDDINSKRTNFDEAIVSFSKLNTVFPKGKIYKIEEKNITQKFGINVSKQLKLLSVGEVSKVIESDSGYYWLMRIDKIHANRPATYQESKEIIENTLGNNSIQELENKTLKNIVVHEKITIN